MLGGTVTTPETPVAAKNEMTDRLAQCTTIEEMDTLREYALLHGYHPDGQFFTAWFAKAEEMLGDAFSAVIAQHMPAFEAKREQHRQGEREVLERQREELDRKLAALKEG